MEDIDGELAFSDAGGLIVELTLSHRSFSRVAGDDLVFGNVFEKPIKDSLPWGTAVAVK